MNEPRHDLAAERQVIGCAVTNQRIIDDCHIRPEDFYRPAHEELWRLIVAEHRAGRPVGIAAIGQRLHTAKIPGVDPDYIIECADEITEPTTGPYYARTVAALARLRRLEQAGARLVQMARDTAWDAADNALETARAEVDQAADHAAPTTIRTYADALADAMDAWERPDENVHRTGWTDLDGILNGGWRPGHLTVMGARPAVGKSLIAACAAVQAAKTGSGVTFFALEMSEMETVARIAANAAGVDLGRIESRALTDLDWQRIARHHGASLEWPLVIDDRNRLTMAQVRAKVRSVQRRFPTPLVVVDYIQLVMPADRAEQRERQVSRIAEDCKLLAKEFGVHVLACAQVNRGPMQRTDKRPTMSDLRESGGLEAHADEVILLHRDEESPGEIELHVEKNRHGRTGQVTLAWAPHVAQARSLAYGREETA